MMPCLMFRYVQGQLPKKERNSQEAGGGEDVDEEDKNEESVKRMQGRSWEAANELKHSLRNPLDTIMNGFVALAQSSEDVTVYLMH